MRHVLDEETQVTLTHTNTHTYTQKQHILVTSAHLLAFSTTLSISKYFNEPIFETHLRTQMHGG